MKTRRLGFWRSVGCVALGASALLGCGADSVEPPNPQATGGGEVPEGWTKLIDGTWEIGGGSESYWCATKTFTEDLYISAFRDLSPTGTHHTVLLYGDGKLPDYETVCGPALDESLLFASGVGTDDLFFPEGVALKISAGTQLRLNIHLYNTNTTLLDGVSGTLVKTIPASEVTQEAEMIMPGTSDISIPPKSNGTAQGDCTFPGDSTIMNVWPHMHKYGTRMRVTHQVGTEEVTIHDAPFAFGEQINHPLAPVSVHAGERIRYECSYMNTTAKEIGFGISSDDEMCFMGLYRYPKLASACSH